MRILSWLTARGDGNYRSIAVITTIGATFHYQAIRIAAA
jgi:hypothetical protein